MPRRGRKSKLTRELIDRIAEAVEAGASLSAAAEANGVSRQTLFRWLDEAKQDGRSALKRELSDEITQAQARYAVALGQTLRRAAVENGDWKAAMSILERRWPEDWKLVEKREVTANVDANVKHELSDETLALLSDTELYALAVAERKRQLWIEADGDKRKYEELCESDEELKQFIADLEARRENGGRLFDLRKLSKRGGQRG